MTLRPKTGSLDAVPHDGQLSDNPKQKRTLVCDPLYGRSKVIRNGPAFAAAWATAWSTCSSGKAVAAK